MKDTSKQILFWVITIFILIPSSAYIGYKYGYKYALKRQRVLPKKESKTPLPEVKKEVKEQKKKVKKVKLAKSEKQLYKLSCEEARKNFLEFLAYLNNKPYIQKYCNGKDIKIVLADIIKRLSKSPPVSRGEGVNTEIMINNIYHLFRVLSLNEIKMIKAIIEKESDQLEYVIRWYYIWFSSKKECPDPYGLLISDNIAYKYALFFLNTIGGKAYLFRRPTLLRLLITYYCLLTVYKQSPTALLQRKASVLKDEIFRYPELVFQPMYLKKLEEIATKNS